MQHGYGTEKWLISNNSTFSGMFEFGLRNGQGVWITELKKYEGNWVNNLMEGKGTMEYF